MRAQRYHITMQGPFQNMEGELLLQLDRTEVSGCVQVWDRSSYFQGRMLRRNRYAAALRLKTDVYEEDCDMLLRVQPSGALRGSVMGEWGTWTLEGTAAEDLPAPEAPAPVEAGNP